MLSWDEDTPPNAQPTILLRRGWKEASILARSTIYASLSEGHVRADKTALPTQSAFDGEKCRKPKDGLPFIYGSVIIRNGPLTCIRQETPPMIARRFVVPSNFSRRAADITDDNGICRLPEGHNIEKRSGCLQGCARVDGYYQKPMSHRNAPCCHPHCAACGGKSNLGCCFGFKSAEDGTCHCPDGILGKYDQAPANDCRGKEHLL